MKKFDELNVQQSEHKFCGDKIAMKKLLRKKVIIEDYRIVPSKFPEKGNEHRLDLQILLGEEQHITWTISKGLQETIQKIDKKDLPFETVIVSKNDRYIFT